MEKYNEKKMQELLQASGQTRADFRRGMNNLDDRIAKNYLAGGDLSVGKLLMAARWFGVSVLEFFETEETVHETFAGEPQIARGAGGKHSGAEPEQEQGVMGKEQEWEKGREVDVLAQPYVTATAEALLASERKEHEKELAHMQEVMQLRIGYERELAALERENSILREALEKNTDGANGHSALLMTARNCEDYYTTRAAEQEQDL